MTSLHEPVPASAGGGRDTRDDAPGGGAGSRGAGGSHGTGGGAVSVPAHPPAGSTSTGGGERPGRTAAAQGTASPWLHGLNPAQLQAVTSLHGPVLVIAGAGTGKTRTLVHRLAELVASGVPAESILLLTFTRRAAAEMLARTRELVGARARRLSGGTFHSFANGLLRRFGAAVGLSHGFSVIDQADTFAILGNLRTDLGLGERGRGFPRRETIAAVLSKAVNQQVSIPEILERDYPHLLDEEQAFSQIGDQYRAYKTERGLVDFDDLLCLLVELLREHPEVRQRVQQRYRYVMVDEYQDTNPLQAEATRLLAGPQRNLMVVGDDAQSIYAFRGACFRNLFDFADQFPEAKRITLEQNYRSCQPVLDLANALLGQMSRSFRKRLFTERGSDERPLLVEAADEEEQARWVGHEIARLHAAGLPLSEIGVLFRAGYHSFPLELELGQRRIPFIKYGGFRFLDAAHIKDLLAPLRVVANPADDLSLGRCLELCHGIGRAGARKLIARAAGSSGPAELGSALILAAGRSKASGEVQRVGELLTALAASREDPLACLQLALEDYLPRLKEQYDDWPKRLRDLEQLAGLCRRYRSLEAMLTDLALDPPSTSGAGQMLAAPPGAPARPDEPDDAGEGDGPAGADGGAGEGDEAGGPAAEDARPPAAGGGKARAGAAAGKHGKDSDDEDRLVLSTLHSAKGLEWKAVFVIQALDGCIPYVADPFGDEDDEQLDEELRLLYVAVTRARDRLALVWPRSTARGFGGGWADESRFLADVPQNLLERRRARDLLSGRREKSQRRR